MRRINLHNHTIFSDGLLLPDQLIREALDYDTEIVGISDHLFDMPSDKTRRVLLEGGDQELPPEELFRRMSLPIHPGDLRAGTFVKEMNVETYGAVMRLFANNYQGRIRVLIGGELNIPTLLDRLPQLVPVLRQHFDYVLFEGVRGRETLERLAAIRKELPFPCGLAHTNYPEAFPSFGTRELIDGLVRADIFAEINTAYPEAYRASQAFFKAAADSDLVVSIGTDTHGFARQLGDVRDGERFAKKLGLEARFAFWDRFL